MADWTLHIYKLVATHVKYVETNQIFSVFYSVNANAGYENGGLGLQGGFNTPIGDFNAQGGLRAPTFGNNNLLTGLVVFLGVLSLINILATVFVPWISNLGGGDEDEEKSIEKNVEKGRRYQRNINMVADYVLNGIESFANKHE